MRLSEAIRKGSVGKAQTRNWLGDGVTVACAMGAALIGAGLVPDSWEQYEPTFPLAVGLPGPCPVCERDESSFFYVVTHLNNVHRWTFEQIADWVQAQEAIHGIGIEAEKPELVNA